MWTPKDLLVRLYDLPQIDDVIEDLQRDGITIRRPRAYEKPYVVDWVEQAFNQGWAGECEVTFSRQPVSTFIATKGGEPIGFACYEATYRNFFGPLAVIDAYRGHGVAMALTVRSLNAMAELGYAYAILGGAGDSAPIYSRWVGAVEIEGSTPGIYVDILTSQRAASEKALP